MNKTISVVATVAGLIGASAMFTVLNMGLIPNISNVPENQVETSSEKKVLYWVAPMDPTFRSDGPGKSPMGMDLVPVYEEQGQLNDDDPAVVRIDPSVINNIGVRTAAVQRGDLTHPVRTVGYLNYDESKISHLHVRANGWIENLVVKSVGERVRRGQLLFEYYSPDLANAQSEYLQALQTKREGLIRASGERLRAFGFSNAEIENLQEKRKIRRLVQIHANQDGVVAELNVRGGMYVMPNMNVMTLADLSSVWLLADVFENQTHSIEVGQVAYMSLSYVPGKIWEGTVEYVYPTLDLNSRTLKVRLKFDNPNEELKPNMYAKVNIAGSGRENVLTVPLEALIRTGSSERVVLALGDGRYKVAGVRTGIEANGLVEIREGVDDGDQVVTSSQFLIDSEASLLASILRMSEVEPADVELMEETLPPNPVSKAKAVINSIMVEHGMVNVTHDPIPSIGWPAMTMDFTVNDDVSLNKVQVGETVEISLTRTDANAYEIIKIDVAGSDGVK